MGSLGYKVPDGKYSNKLISERAFDQPRPLKVIYIGAGISGICASIMFPKYVPTVDLVVYEKNADVGGTWFENRYPGCACDIPAHSYQLSFESSVEWSQFYAGAPEILKYWQSVADKYKIRKFMKFGHKCVEARWNDETSQWHVKIERLETGEVFEDVGDVFMTGIGGLNDWKWPDIQGLHDFKGHLMHSANWDSTFDAKNKTIAVIGAGSSGIQIVPALQPQVASMDHYIRGQTWIAATFGNQCVRERNDGKDGNFNYNLEEMEEWKRNPESYIKYRKFLETGMQSGFAVTHRDTEVHAAAWAAFDEDMRNRLQKKPEVIEHMIPSFPPLCKRLTPGPGYLEALTADNVNVVTSKISHIDATGIVTEDGKHRPVDAIVCATGFDTSFRRRFPIYGRGGVSLEEKRQNRAESYLSLAIDGMPNFYQALGPNSALGTGNLLITLEAAHLYVGQILQKLCYENVKTLEPKRKVVEDFTNYCDAFFKRTVFSAECSSWYKSAPPDATPEERKRGRITALWPGSSIHFLRAVQKVRFEDYEMESFDDNDFGWFGDGWTIAERTQDVEGLTWYLNNTKFLHEDLPEDEKSSTKPATNGSVSTEEFQKQEFGEELKAPENIAAT